MFLCACVRACVFGPVNELMLGWPALGVSDVGCGCFYIDLCFLFVNKITVFFWVLDDVTNNALLLNIRCRYNLVWQKLLNFSGPFPWKQVVHDTEVPYYLSHMNAYGTCMTP